MLGFGIWYFVGIWPLGFGIACVAFLGILIPLPVHAQGASKASINPDGVLLIDGTKTFPIGFCLGPPHDGKAPDGRPAYAELKDAGANFLQTGAMGNTEWNAEFLALEQARLDAAAKHGMHVWLGLKDLAAVEEVERDKQALLRSVVNRFKGHPALGAWLSVDEPEWKKLPAEPMVRGTRIVRELDPDHPVWVNHAPRGTIESLRPYNAACDVTGTDVYPVGYPPGTHSDRPNKAVSMVGDFTRFFREVGEGRPVWIYLQVAWSGVVKEGKTLRFPTFPEERFMAYQAIVNGARGLIFFGGSLPQAMTEEDRRLGWNWRFWNRVLRPVVEEIGEKSPLQPALVAADSKLPVKVEKGPGIEFCVREVGKEIFLIACRREETTVQVKFSGLPSDLGAGDVMFEAPRKVEAKGGVFSDWFGPNEVHVYRFRR